MRHALLETNLGRYPVRRGKVRDVYDLGNQLLIVSTDRISAFDWVMPNGVPDKGRVLTHISTFWFRQLRTSHHLLSTDLTGIELPPDVDRSQLHGRSMLVKKCDVVPIECVVRGYLDGSGWKEYQQSGEVCGVKLPSGLKQCSKLPEPIFTPATKEETGHDVNISFARMVEIVGRETAEELRRRSLDIYSQGSAHTAPLGIIIADTKFEWGWHQGELILIDEVLTPDSSRFWPADRYQPGGAQPSFDKQFVRDWLTAAGWDKNSPPPRLPDDVVERTREKYIEAAERITGEPFPWK